MWLAVARHYRYFLVMCHMDNYEYKKKDNNGSQNEKIISITSHVSQLYFTTAFPPATILVVAR